MKPGVPLPSPEDLKYKILVKYRQKSKQQQAHQHQHQQSTHSTQSGQSAATHQRHFGLRAMSFMGSLSGDAASGAVQSSVNSNSSNAIKNILLMRTHHKEASISSSISADGGGGGDGFSPPTCGSSCRASSSKRNRAVALAQLSRHFSSLKRLPPPPSMNELVNYLQPTSFVSFESALKCNKSYELSSFVETHAVTLHKMHPVEFVK